MGNFDAALTGLANGLNAYLGKSIDNQQQMAMVQKKSELETQQMKDVMDYKQDQQGDATPEMMEELFGQISPEFGKAAGNAIRQAEQANGRRIKFTEVNSTLDPIMKALQMKNQKSEISDLKYEMQQDKLEKEYRADITRVLRSREAPGQELTKLNQAIHIQQMVNEAYDPKTGQFNLPPSLHTEMALSMARMLSGTGQPSEKLVEELRQKTAREGLAGLAIYMGADPKKVGGSTQNVVNLFRNQITRQAKTSQHLVKGYISQAKKMAPTRLSADRRKALEDAEIGPEFADYIEGGKYADIGMDQSENNGGQSSGGWSYVGPAK